MGIQAQEMRAIRENQERLYGAELMSEGMSDDDGADDGADLVLDATTFDVRIHDGMVTIQSPTGAHRTFRVKNQGDDAGWMPGKRVVSLLRGPDRDDWSAWTSFAFVDGQGVKVWNKHRGTVLDTYGRMLSDPQGWSARGCTYRVEARCRRCGRALTHPESIATGLGPVCAGR